MGIFLKNLDIKNFRALKEIKIDRLGRVNLLTGRNNTGKSSVLEALRLWASNASPNVIFNILNNREEVIQEGREPRNQIEPSDLAQMSSLFHGFPLNAKDYQPISISTKSGSRQIKITMSVGWYSRNSKGLTRVYKQKGLLPEDDLLSGDEIISAIMVETDGDMKRIFTSSLWRDMRFREPFARADEGRVPCEFVSPYGGEGTATLGRLWDGIALSDLENDVVEALKLIDPSITAVSMVGGENNRRIRTAIVRTDNLPRPVPLRSFGDGLNRLFGIALSLVNAKNGLLLIDEFENGIHHSVQTDAWRMIFRLSKRLNIQVFATSHSWDAIKAFQGAANEDNEDGVLIRLTRKNSKVIPTIFTENELLIATQESIEVR